MSILIAQLGDIHLETPADPAVARAPQIGAAIASEVAADTRAVIIAICGDTAYSGTEGQFQASRSFIKSIEGEIRNRYAHIKIYRVLVPGNHDCDFSGDQAARDGLLSSISGAERPAQSIVDIVMKPLEEYFRFAKDFIGMEKSISREHAFYRAVDIADGDSRLRIHLINTAWMSTMRERQGSLHFPLAEIQPPSDHPDCSFAILHHPTHWFSQPHVMRSLRDRLSELASVVLVNHEHVSEASEQVPLMDRDGSAARTIYVCGGVIQERGAPELCSFNTLKIDVALRRLVLARHEYRQNNGQPYFERTAEDAVGLSTQDLSKGPAGVSLRREMVDLLEDPGAPISHPNRDPRISVRLSDIFLYPDLWELDVDHDGSDQKQIKSSNVAEEVLATEKTLITGGEKSGRTAIVKSLFMRAFEKGRVPVLLRGVDIPKSADRLRKHIRDAVSKQYGNLAPDRFEQLARSDKVVLVDDAHQMAPAEMHRRELIQELERQFGAVVFCGDDLIKMEEMNGRDAKRSGLWEYRHLIILGFGEYLREQFVRKWLMLGGDTFVGDVRLESEVVRICGLLNVVIKKQLLPAYPLFLLVVLQQSDLANASVQGGSFGKLFEGLMTAILNRSSFHRINIGDKYHYLAALSMKMYERSSMELSLGDAKRWHRGYWEDIELEVDFDRLVNDLEKLGVLTVGDDTVRFRYAYFFCFFVAYFLNRSLHEAASRQVISHLSKQLHHRISADIVLFLAHLTGDPIVLDEMASTCDGLFSDVLPATLHGDVDAINRLAETMVPIAISDSPDENRLELQHQRDALVAERLSGNPRYAEALYLKGGMSSGGSSRLSIRPIEATWIMATDERS